MQYFHKSHINENGSVNRDIRSTTATSTKTVTSWARYPSSKLVGAVSARKRENHGRFSLVTSAHVVVKTSNLIITRPCYAEGRQNICLTSCCTCSFLFQPMKEPMS